MKITLVSLIILISAGKVFSQDIETLLKRDLDAERRTVVAQSIDIPSGKETEFWEIYSDMELELDKITMNRIANIKNFAHRYDDITDKEANELIGNFIDMNFKRHKIYKKYYKKMNKIISTKQAARLVQILNQIQLIIDVQFAAEAPLIN
jgi:hypothetical protein